MTSRRKILANRNNAQKSTGPKTERGKQLASLNALKTGAYSRFPILPTEDPKAYEDLARSVYEDLEPEGVVQCALANQVLADIVRLQRLERADGTRLEGRVRWNAWHRSLEPIREEIRAEGINDFELSFRGLVQERAEGRDHPGDVEPEEEDLLNVLTEDLDESHSTFNERVEKRRKSLVSDIIRNTKAIEDLQKKRMKILDLKSEE
jgi:hypothetical protein